MARVHNVVGEVLLLPFAATMSNPQVGIVNYGSGNIQSLRNALEHLGVSVRLVTLDGEFDRLTHLMLPGVGAFGYCSHRLKSSGLLPAIERWAMMEQRPILGVCVGMQLFADSSDEHGYQEGLGWLGGSVKRLVSSDPDIRVPHVGWNNVNFQLNFGEFLVGDERDFYFDHSFACRADARSILATCFHGEQFCAAVQCANIVGAQFHPEKSQSAGLSFLRSFLAM